MPTRHGRIGELRNPHKLLACDLVGHDVFTSLHRSDTMSDLVGRNTSSLKVSLGMFRRRDVDIQGVKTAFWEMNQNSPHAVLLVHGLKGNHFGLMPVAQHIRNLRVIVPDRPGYGMSPPMSVRHTIGNYAMWLGAFADSFDVERLAIIGHSSGALISIVNAALGVSRPHPIIAVTPAVARRDVLLWLTSGYYAVSHAMPRHLQKRWLTSRVVDRVGDRVLFHDAVARVAWMRQRDLDRPTFRSKVLQEEYTSVARLDWQACARRVTVPVLVIGGSSDIVTPKRQLGLLSKLIPDCTTAVLSGAGHMVPIEKPELIAQLAEDYFTNTAFGDS